MTYSPIDAEVLRKYNVWCVQRLKNEAACITAHLSDPATGGVSYTTGVTMPELEAAWDAFTTYYDNEICLAYAHRMYNMTAEVIDVNGKARGAYSVVDILATVAEDLEHFKDKRRNFEVAVVDTWNAVQKVIKWKASDAAGNRECSRCKHFRHRSYYCTGVAKSDGFCLQGIVGKRTQSTDTCSAFKADESSNQSNEEGKGNSNGETNEL